MLIVCYFLFYVCQNLSSELRPRMLAKKLNYGNKLLLQWAAT